MCVPINGEISRNFPWWDFKIILAIAPIKEKSQLLEE